MSAISTYQGGQSDLELASADCAVLLRPVTSAAGILTNLEDATAGGLDATKIGSDSGFVTVGNWTKRDGLKLSNNPTVNEIKSHGKGTPTAFIASESEKSITYTPQEFKLINLKNAWGFNDSAVSSVSSKGGFTVQLPELPATLFWQTVLLSWTSYNGLDIYKYWIFNKAVVAKRSDITLMDSDVITHGVTLAAQTHPALPGVPVVFGACGAGIAALAANTSDYSIYPAATGITLTPAPTTATAAAGAGHTRQLSVKDSNQLDRTATATYASSDVAKATVSSTGLVTGVSAGTATITATYLGYTATTVVTVS